MNETNIQIKELREKIEELEERIAVLKSKNSNYYIGVYSIGDGNYWDEYYCRLGCITEEQAEDWVNKTLDGDVYEAWYFDVTEEKYKKFGDWFELDKLRRSINMYNAAISGLKNVDTFVNTVGEAIRELAKEIGIEYLSFMHPAN